MSREDLPRGRAAVDLRVGGVVELLRHEVRRCSSRTSSSAAKTAPVMPSIAGVRIELRRRSACSSRRRSMLMSSGIVRIELVALDRGDHRQADAGVAAGRLDDRVAGLEQPARSASSIIARAMRSLTLPPGLSDSILPRTSAAAGRHDAAQADQRRVADEVEHAVGDAAAGRTSVRRRSDDIAASDAVVLAARARRGRRW